MAYSIEDKERLFTEVCISVADGFSLRSILKKPEMPSRTEFYSWISEDKTGVKKSQYARACEDRADGIFDELLDIADDSSDDKMIFLKEDGSESERVDTEHIQRSKLRVDTRKWVLSKMLPKKYGEKLDVTTDGEKLSTVTIFRLPNDGRNG